MAARSKTKGGTPPFTSGKNKQMSANSGGHTSRGVVLPASSAAGSTSKANNRTGSLKKNPRGAGGTKGMPK